MTKFSEVEKLIHEISRLYRTNTQAVIDYIKNGGDVNATDEFGTTPLMVSCLYGSLEQVKLLLEAGANASLRDKEFNKTALQHVIRFENIPNRNDRKKCFRTLHDADKIKDLLKSHGAVA